MKTVFNDSQNAAITHVNGPCLVLSGPGSGKTLVLTNRILNLVTKCRVNPVNILVLTFTRAAVDEMKNRYLKLVRENNVRVNFEPTFGTFHSVFYEILRDEFGYNKDSLLTDSEERTILMEVLLNEKRMKVTKELICNILCDIHDYKLSIERDEYFTPKYISSRLFKKIYNEFQSTLYFYKKLNFDDMISMCDTLLRKYKKVLTFYREKYKYILIDEFQDINESQFNIIRLLGKSNNIFVVGDDDQSIYKFRGSKSSIFKDFLKYYKKTRVIYLNENYRCADSIVKCSKIVIDNNKIRFNKNLVSKRNVNGKVIIKSFYDSKDENEYIIKNILEYRKKGLKFSDIAVLYRTNLMSKTIKDFFIKNKIPYIIKDENEDDYIEDAVNLMTFHLSKGLEFKVVFIIDANDGIIPHKKSIIEDDLETERRLFYVAMTRAKDNLHICFTNRRFGKNYTVSRFVIEILGGKNE